MAIIETERYIIEPRPLGRGGFGEVYQAKDLLFDRDVVIKTIMLSQLYGIDEPAARRQFFREAVVSARLGHTCPYVVKVLDYGYDRDTDKPFFVMELVKGGNLVARIGTFSWREAGHLLHDVLTALFMAHQKQVIHSDISPDNILYDPDKPKYKINDFGLAKLLTSALISRRPSLSITGGKPDYLPIDQWQTGERDQYSDLYGLAVTITELITGKPPRMQIDYKNRTFTRESIAQLEQVDNPDEEVFRLANAARSPDLPIGVPGTRYYGHNAVIFKGDVAGLLLNILDRNIQTSQQAIEFLNASMVKRNDAEDQRIKAKQEEERRQAENAMREVKESEPTSAPSQESDASVDGNSNAGTA